MDGDNQGAPIPPISPRGSANWVLQAAAYYDPSLVDNALVQNTRNMNNDKMPGQEGILGKR